MKTSIRFYDDREVRAIWDDSASKWWFSVLDIVAAINRESDYAKTRNYWKYLKAKLKKEGGQLVSATTQLKLRAPDGKLRMTDCLDSDGVVALAKADFWRKHQADELSANQRKMLNMLFDGFDGNLTSSKWAKICKVSQDTASRDINSLIAKDILRQEGQGRSTHYVLNKDI